MTDLSFDLISIRIILALCMLSIASILDLRKREINDIIWIGFGILAFILILISGVLGNSLVTIGISLIIAPIALLIWRIGIFGGADALCLIVLAGLAPMVSFSSGQITPFTTLTNAAMLSIIPIFVNLTRNLFAMLKKSDIFEDFDETRLNKIVAVFVGYKARNPRYSFSIEKIVGGQRRLDFSFRHAESASFCNATGTWVTPGIPYIIYIAGGFVIQIIYGDIVVNLMQYIR